ncbi:MAG: hypothetical protein AAGM84_17200 [Pseudomonadota bacterium]
MSHPHRPQYLLAELAGLRAEIIGHQAARYNVDQLGLAAIIAIYAWILSTGTASALVLPPAVALVATLRQQSIAFSITTIASYIRKLEQELAGGGWEDWLASEDIPKRITRLSTTVWVSVLIGTTAIAIAEAAGLGLLDLVTTRKGTP